jgi:hypothetical protein
LINKDLRVLLLPNPDCCQFDANLFISYLLDEGDTAKLVRHKLEPSNPSNSYIVISTNEIGEISKRLISYYNEAKWDDRITKRIGKLTNLWKNERIKIKRFQDVIENHNNAKKFVDSFEFLNGKLGYRDQRVQLSDRVNLSFFALTEARTYYTADNNILESEDIRKYFEKEYNKNIKELE